MNQTLPKIKIDKILGKLNPKDYLKNIDPLIFKKILLSLYILLLFSTLYHLLYARRIIPGVKVAGVKVGGMTFNQARKALEDKEKETIKELKLRYDDKDFIIKADDIYLTYDWDSSVTRAFEVGRTGNVLSDSKEKVVGLFKSLVVPASYDYDDGSLGIKFSIIRGEVNKEPRQAGVFIATEDITNKALVNKPSEAPLSVSSSDRGRKIIEDQLYSLVIKSFDNMDFSDKTVPIKVVVPQVSEEDVQDLLSEVKEVIAQDVKIVYGTKSWTLNSSQLLELIGFEKEEGKAKITLNKPKFDAYVETIEAEVNELPRGQVVSNDGKTVAEFKLIRDGKELDADKFSDELKKSMFNKRVVVDLPVSKVNGLTDKSKYGIYALLGEGTSHFAGSIPSRIHNLTLAAERTNGVLVAPGKIYSLNESVGDIEWETGYQMAYIIKGDRTVLGAGGGVCQTSTTMFRAVLNSGLPVVMRNPHAYRVGYYEQDMPVGFDAAVFQPSWDFRFKNDTSAYILIQSSWNLSENSLTFKFFGTPDGRTVEISKPLITNQSPPPEPLYQDDPTLPKGTTVQVEHPAWGASVTFTRTVKKGEDVKFTDTFNSRYQPWRSVYLVGTKE